MPTRVALPQLGQISARLERLIGASISMMPPVCCMVRGRWCFLTMLMPVTSARFSLGITFRTWPCLPLSLPDITNTLSFVLILFMALGGGPGLGVGGRGCTPSQPWPLASGPWPLLYDFWRERDDLHVVLLAQLTRHRAEDAGAARVLLIAQDHRGVLVEADVGAIRPPVLLRHAHDHGAHHIALLHRSPRLRRLHRGDDDVAHTRIAPAGAAGDEDAHDL